MGKEIENKKAPPPGFFTGKRSTIYKKRDCETSKKGFYSR
jgi:hypothetical protein